MVFRRFAMARIAAEGGAEEAGGPDEGRLAVDFDAPGATVERPSPRQSDASCPAGRPLSQRGAARVRAPDLLSLARAAHGSLQCDDDPRLAAARLSRIFLRRSISPIFRRRLATAFRHASAFIVSTETVKARLQRETVAAGIAPRPIHVQPFPSPLEAAARPQPARREPWRGHPYFVVLGTIEPRKNHLLSLHLWRRLVAERPGAPRLVLVGARGWESEQIADMLDRWPFDTGTCPRDRRAAVRRPRPLLRGARRC